MKLTRVEPSKLDEYVPLIARFANTQNPVQVADLSANNAFHIRLEQLAGDVWCPGEESRWFYERARGAYQVARTRFGSTPAKRRDFDDEIPKRQVISKTDLARYLMSWWQHPDVVSRGAQKNFSIFMSELRDRYGSDWLPDPEFFRSVVAIALVFKAAQAAIRRAKVQSYGANVATYMVAKLATDHGETFDLDAIWEGQEVSPELVATLESWVTPIHSQLVTSAGQRNVTEWCKKDACWEHIKGQALPVLSPIPPEFMPAEPPERSLPSPSAAIHDEGDTSLVDACCRLDGAAWAKVMAWAATSPAVTDFDRRVAHSVMGYALESWRRRPSEKQAVYAARVVEAARHAGVIPAP
jgi:AIPR protein